LVSLTRTTQIEVFENGERRSILGPEKDEVDGTGTNCILSSFTICIFQQLLLGLQNEMQREEWDMQHTWADEKCIEFWFGNPEGKRALGRQIHRWEDNIKQILRH
jgi:hypothetical protein